MFDERNLKSTDLVNVEIECAAGSGVLPGSPPVYIRTWSIKNPTPQETQTPVPLFPLEKKK